jgi:hypothetical protein
MPFLQQGRDAQVVIPAGQSIRVGALRGASASISIPQGLPGGPTQSVTDGQSVYGPYPAGATVTVEAVYGEAEYVVSANPFLTDGLYNSGAVSITGGAVNNTTIGVATPNTGSFTTLRFAIGGSLNCALIDGSGTPGNVTQNQPRGRAAFAAAGASVAVTNSLVAANSTILVSLGGADATLTSVRVTPGAGSFTVTGNAAATGITPFDYLVIQN